MKILDRSPEKSAPTLTRPKTISRPSEKPAEKAKPVERVEKSAETSEGGKASERAPSAGFFNALGSNFAGEEDAHNGAHNEDGAGPFEVPNESDDSVVGADESERTDEIAEQQTQSVSEGVESGDEFDFTNSEGQEIQATVREDDGNYYVETSQGARYDVNFEGDYTAEEREAAVAQILDYQSQVPEEYQDATEEVLITDREHDDGAPATYTDSERRITFYEGTQNIDERIYIHESGHAIGYEAERRSDSWGDRNFPWRQGDEDAERGAPEGWLDAIEGDGTSVSEYANTNWREDFAEFYLAYHEAEEAGPEALAELQEQYPERYALVEETYGQAA